MGFVYFLEEGEDSSSNNRPLRKRRIFILEAGARHRMWKERCLKRERARKGEDG